uniref:Nucleoplasmin core domain-containing protein n=1 Tax=Accipiter nisus TaxID=211598 RepID=A0A8B9M9C6_9AVES
MLLPQLWSFGSREFALSALKSHFFHVFLLQSSRTLFSLVFVSQDLRSLGSSHVHGRCCVPAGCQLNTSTRTCVVKEDDDLLEHLVLLKTICLGAEAGDELHVVAVDSKNTYGDHKPVPIAALRTSVLPMISLKGLELVPPVTFVLKCGAGPVYLSGQHITRECCEARASVWARGCTGGGPVGPMVALVAPGALSRAASPQGWREHWSAGQSSARLHSWAQLDVSSQLSALPLLL